MKEDLESLIKRHVVLGPEQRGFYQVKCMSCNDYKIRGGFKFDGETIIYSCFNCGIKAKYEPDSRISNTMKSILTAFGIPEIEIKRVINSRFFNRETISSSECSNEKQPVGLPYRQANLPENSVEITTNESPWCEVAREYVKSRGLSIEETTFYVSDHPKHQARLIIPYLFRNKIVYWQGRSMDSSVEPRYISSGGDRSNIFYNMDELYRYTTEPLFVTEGPIDAISIGKQAVATLGSSLSEFQIQELKKAASRRKVIFVIDKNKNGFKLGHRVLSEQEDNFFLTVLPDNIDDSNDALKKLGRLFLITHLVTSGFQGVQAKLILKMKCKVK